METKSVKHIALLFFAFILAMSAYFVVTALVSEPQQASAATKYKLEVNTKKCVVTAYKKKSGKWRPFRAMLCSPGASGASPKGTYGLGTKYRWLQMMGGVYAQYCGYIANNCLFHSVWYYECNPKTQSTYQYNQLGKAVSHGCVRLSVVDAKWIYDNCKKGTKVHLSDSAPTPLGKPKLYKTKGRPSSSWDPTDPNIDNKYLKLSKIVITNGKSASMKKGKTKTLSTKVYSKAKGFAAGSVVTKKYVKFSSNKKSVAKVNSNGKITAKGIGKATITAKIKRNGKTVKDTYVVKVYSNITFKACGGKLKGKATLKKKVTGSLSSFVPKRSGYKFKGWYTAKNGGKKITKPKNKSYKLYAHWTKIKTTPDPEPQPTPTPTPGDEEVTS